MQNNTLNHIVQQYSIFDNLIEGVQLISPRLDYIYLNDAILRQANRKREELIGYNMIDRFPSLRGTKALDAIHSCMSEGTPNRLVDKFEFADGSVKYFELRLQRVRDGVLIYSSDVTHEIRTQQLLLDYVEQLTLSQQLAKIGSYKFDLSSQDIRWTDEMFRIFELKDRSDPPRLHEIKSMIHPDDLEDVERALESTIHTGSPLKSEYRIVLNDGRVKHLRGLAKLVERPDKIAGELYGCTQDIDEEKRVEAELRRSEERYRHLFNGIQESFNLFKVVRDGNGSISDLRFIEVNPVTERLMGKARADIIGRRRSELMGEIPTDLLLIFNDVVNSQKSRVIETFNPTLALWCQVFIYSPEDEHIATLNLDITTRKNAEEELRSLNRELDQRVRDRTQEIIQSLEREKALSEIKSRFVTTASHEFRTPLATLLSSIYLIEQYILSGQSDKCFKYIDRARKYGNALTDILDDFLSIEKIEHGKIQLSFEIIDLTEFMEELIGSMHVMLKPGQRLVCQNDTKIMLRSDRKILRNILINLLSNAIKYSDSDINISIVQSAKKIRIAIIDKGIGIPIADQENLFSLFYRAANARKIQGTGLGLNIVKRYMELLNGDLSFTSTENVGSTFIVELTQQNAEGI